MSDFECGSKSGWVGPSRHYPPSAPACVANGQIDGRCTLATSVGQRDSQLELHDIENDRLLNNHLRMT